jgi:hypothetical protein
VSVLCIDSAPNSRFVQTLAARGGGESWFLGSTGNVEEITDAVDRVTALFGAPAVGDLVLHAPAPGSALGRRVASRETATGAGLAIPAGALPAGAVSVLAGWTTGTPEGFRVTAIGMDVALAVQAGREPAVNALVAAAEIAILDEARAAAWTEGGGELARELAAGVGVNPKQLPKGSTYKGTPGARSADKLDEALRTIMVERSLAERVISPATAFVGVRSKAGKVTSGQVDVPSALPAGWDAAFAGGVAMMAAPSPAGAMPPAFMLNASGPAPSTPRAKHALRRTASVVSIATPARAGQQAEGPAAPGAHQVTLEVAALRAAVAAPAPAGSWSLLRASGLDQVQAAELAGVMLVIWSSDRTRPLVRVRLADLLAAGDRPVALTFGNGETINLALEGGAIATGTLRLAFANE